MIGATLWRKKAFQTFERELDGRPLELEVIDREG